MRKAGEPEHRAAEAQWLAAADDVDDAAAGEQEPGERGDVGVDRPGERGVVEAEVMADVRERDVHDRDVEHDGELRREADAQQTGETRAVRIHTSGGLEPVGAGTRATVTRHQTSFLYCSCHSRACAVFRREACRY
jgi:hypothetical protein